MAKRREKLNGQVSIEFALAFTVAILFLVLVARLFVWFCGSVVKRQEAFEESRNCTYATSFLTAPGSPVPDYYTNSTGAFLLPPRGGFYNQSSQENKLDLFKPQ